MRIKKIYQGTIPSNKIVNTYTETNTDTYSCEYLNDHLGGYPVGAIYISTNSTSPASLFGGTWEQIQGRTLIGAGTTTDSRSESKTFTAGSTGGEFNHKLSVSEMPSHRHWISSADYDDGNMTTTDSNQQYYGLFADAGSYSADDRNKSAGRYCAYEGSGSVHNNLPPYIVVYMWKRVS